MFHNLLPTGAGGNLFIPVDTTVMGSGMTPAGHEWMMMNSDQIDPQNPMCSGPGKDAMVAQGLLRRQPGHHPPARRHHPLDQRRHATPVDHPGE